jgi:hypothetical protein
LARERASASTSISIAIGEFRVRVAKKEGR